jgi:K+/H+ antiporter YhaU regulatory subunit KhtT
MDVDRTTVPGKGTVHHFLARGGARFALLTVSDGDKYILVYDDTRDEPIQAVALEPDEADQFAELLRSTPIPDRVARLERLLDRLANERSR